MNRQNNQFSGQQRGETFPQSEIQPLVKPLIGREAIFKQLELLGRNDYDHPYTVIKFNNQIIYAAEWVNSQGGNGQHYSDLKVTKLYNPKVSSKKPLYHPTPNDSCKVFRFSTSDRQIYPNGIDYLDKEAKTGKEIFLIPNYIPLSPDGDNGIGASFVDSFGVFMLEMDDRPIEQQWKLINWFKDLTGLVPLLIVFSGGKSLHVYFGLSEPIADKERWQRIQRKLILIFHSDFQIQNPNREMRLAGVYRKTKEKYQSIVECH